MKKIFILLVFIFNSQTLSADCVYDAKSYKNYKIIDENTIVLQEGNGKNILIQSYCYFYMGSELIILKDDFCDFEQDVLSVDGEVCEVKKVKLLN